MIPFPVIVYINEETAGFNYEDAIGAINETDIGVTIAPRNQAFLFFTSYFTASVASGINRSEFSSDSMILIISSISLIEINK